MNRLDQRNAKRQRMLEELNTWRNAIAHQDWRGIGPGLQLSRVTGWRSACRALATNLDRAVGAHLAGLVGTPPW